MEFELTSGEIVATVRFSDDTVFFGHDNFAPLETELTAALQDPIGLPQLNECCVPGDRVVFVLDPETPRAADVITQVWEQFQTAGSDELDATLLLPQPPYVDAWKTLLEELPVHVRNQMAIHVYDADDEKQRRYLASSAAGDRIYMSHYLTDADLIVSIGVMAFDKLFGCRGTNSAIYPNFSETQAIQAARLASIDSSVAREAHPVRDLADEIGWLLGTQFSVQLIPGADAASSGVVCGLPDDVLAAGKEIVECSSKIVADEEATLAVVTIPGSSVNSWKQFGAALEAARNLVGDGGRIAVLAEFPETAGPAVDMIRRSNDAGELIAPLCKMPTEDGVEAIQIIETAARTTTYLLSNLDAAFVEDLGMLPLANAAEIQRLVDAAESVIVVSNANYVHAQVAVPSHEIS